MASDKKRILLVEDDPSLGFVTKDVLALKGYDVTLCKDGAEAEQTFFAGDYHLCILDIMLPKMDGFSLAKSIRTKNSSVPIIFLSAKAMEEDKLQGFATGGDDYITKPFSLDELLCRIEVFLRRSYSNHQSQETIVFLGKYTFDFSNLTLKNNATEKTLTQKEAEVLKLLYHNRERVLKREEILKHVWGDDDYFMGRSMDVFISKLRKYLKEDPSVQIVNYHGVGFKLES
jgi:DNA-binding response OmpR family regulator